MAQLHKRLTDKQIWTFFQSYCQGTLSRVEIRKYLKSCQYRNTTEGSILNTTYQCIIQLST